MLTYHAAFDVDHAAFRTIQLVEKHPEKRLPVELLRILDFYMLFPHRIGDLTLPNNMLKQKRAYAKLANRYNRVPAGRIFMTQIEGLQEAAIRSLAAKRFLSASELKAGIGARASEPLPVELQRAIDAQTEDDKELVEFLATRLSRIPLMGPNGLKARTGLLEYRYDLV
jgi:hypothetical protein